jgi:TIR domain
MTTEPPEFDFYISANSENAIAQEVARVLREAGYSIYLPERKDEITTKRFAASKSKAFVLPLASNSEQSQFLADILSIAPLGIEERRVVVIQFEDCELAKLIDSSLITNLSGVTDSRARKLRIIDAVEVPLPTGAPTETERPLPALGPEEDTPRSALGPLPLAIEEAPDPVQQDQKIEEVYPLSIEALKEHAASSTPPAVIDQSDSGQPQQHVRYAGANRSSRDALQERPESSIPHADIDQRKPGPIYETGDPAIDDPLTALVEIISEKDPAAIVPSPLRPPKWLAKELAAARIAPTGVTSKARQDNRDARLTAGRELLEFAVSHPTQFLMGEPFIVDALIYRENDRRLAVLRAAELTQNDRFRSSGSNELGRDSKLRVIMNLPWPTEPTTQTVYWSGALSHVSFQVIAPKYATSKTVHGSCGISADGLAIGQVHFQLELGHGASPSARQISRAPAIKSAFACYAKQDRQRVLDRVQRIEKLGVSVFTDVNELRGNEQSKKQIFQVIDSSDVLFLFWSKNAQRSTWIEQEWRYGMERKGAGFIELVPLVDPSKAPPPLELTDRKFFQNWTMINSDYDKSLSLREKVRSWLRY